MTATENLARSFIEFIVESKNNGFLENAIAFADVVSCLGAAKKELANKPDNEQAELINQAVDNMIGTEETALVGPDGKLLKFNIPIMPDELIETLTDVLAKVIADSLAKVI